MGGCYSCGGYTFAKPLCGGIGGVRDPRIMKRCHCNDTSMEKAARAFAWVAYIIAVTDLVDEIAPCDRPPLPRD